MLVYLASQHQLCKLLNLPSNENQDLIFDTLQERGIRVRVASDKSLLIESTSPKSTYTQGSGYSVGGGESFDNDEPPA